MNSGATTVKVPKGVFTSTHHDRIAEMLMKITALKAKLYLVYLYLCRLTASVNWTKKKKTLTRWEASVLKFNVMLEF